MRRSTSTLCILLCAIIFPCGAQKTHASASPAPDRQKIRNMLKLYWDSIETLNVQGEEYVCNEDGRRATRPGLYIQTFDIAVGSGGRRALRYETIAPDGGVTVLFNLREDGRKFYVIEPFVDDPNTIDVVIIKNQVDTHDHWTGPMALFLWLWSPGGKPLFSFIDEGASLDSQADSAKGAYVRMVASHKGSKLIISLDPLHDWLPTKIELDDETEFVATQYARKGGLWFPIEGTYTTRVKPIQGTYTTRVKPIEGTLTTRVKRRNRANTRGFLVKSLKVNQAIDPSVFGLPVLPNGVVVKDETGGPSGIRGTIQDREALDAKHTKATGVPDTKHATSSSASVAASADPPRFPLSLVLALLSLGILVSVSWLRMRESGRQFRKC